MQYSGKQATFLWSLHKCWIFFLLLLNCVDFWGKARRAMSLFFISPLAPSLLYTVPTYTCSFSKVVSTKKASSCLGSARSTIYTRGLLVAVILRISDRCYIYSLTQQLGIDACLIYLQVRELCTWVFREETTPLWEDLFLPMYQWHEAMLLFFFIFDDWCLWWLRL